MMDGKMCKTCPLQRKAMAFVGAWIADASDVLEFLLPWIA